MDSIDDSLLTQIVLQLAHHAGRFRQNWHITIILSSGFAMYYALFGRRRDVALIAVAAALAVPPETRQHVLISWKLTMFSSVLVAACSVIFLRLMTFTTSSVFLRGRNTLPAHAWTESAGTVFIPSRTTHSRFFPQKHSFAYSYLTVGIPVGLRSEINGILSVDPRQPPPPSSRQRWWWQWISGLVSSPVYKVDAANYLARGIDPGGLRAKLNRFLSSQKINPNHYPYAFLVTAPQFLGYSFNPVSFWYLYSPAKVLSAMILEVNNTFDERRPYLVFRDFEQEESKEEKQHVESSTTTTTTTTTIDVEGRKSSRVPRISASFEKDFHVSPFNSRKGSYSVLSKDPLGTGMRGFRGLDVTINLRSSKGHPKLVARLVNHTAAIDVASMSITQKIVFASRYFWIGFATFPRIVKEAAFLFYKRSLHVWYRPEPLKQSLGRHATATERDLECVFRDYLRCRVEQCPESLRVRYVASGLGTSATQEIFMSSAAAAEVAKIHSDDDGDDSEGADNGEDGEEHEILDAGFELRVLTPVFYSRLVHYTDDLEGILNEATKSGTVAIDKPDMLTHIFSPKQQSAAPSPLHRSSGLTAYIYWRLIQTLRRMPEPIHRPLTSAAETGVGDGKDASQRNPIDSRHWHVSAMDKYVLHHSSDSLIRNYQYAVLRLFLADRFFFGSEQLLSVAEFLWRAGVAYVLVSAIYN